MGLNGRVQRLHRVVPPNSITTEGGTRYPCIVRYPQGIPQQREGSIDSTFTTVMDILPTFLDLAGVEHPAPTFQVREVAPLREEELDASAIGPQVQRGLDLQWRERYHRWTGAAR